MLGNYVYVPTLFVFFSGDMSFNQYARKPASRGQMLVNLAIKGIDNNNTNEDLNVPDLFMSNSYDPTQGLQTSDLNQNVSNVVQNLPSENMENSLIFEELKDVTYHKLLDPFIDKSEMDLIKDKPEIDCGIPEISDSINKRYILDEVTGQLREDTKLFEENFNEDNNYYLDEKTGELILGKNTTVYRNEDFYSTSETEMSLSDEEINNKQRKFNKLKRVCGKKYTGRKRKCDETGEKASYELVPRPRKYLKEKPCTHSCISKSDRSYLCGLISEQKRKAVFDYFWSLTTWDAKKAYLKTLVRMRPVLRRRKTTSNSEDASQKQLAYDYYFTDDQNVTVKVCKSFFVSTLNINSDTLSEWIKKLQDNTVEGQDLSSKHEKRQSIINPLPKVIKSTTVTNSIYGEIWRLSESF